jgi:hypothetical protein
MKLIPQRKNLFEHEYAELESEYKIPTKSLIIYEGHLIDEPSTSFVSGSIIDGKFSGTITTNNEKYFIEPSKRFDIEASDKNEHSIIYKEKDIKLSNKTKKFKRNLETNNREFYDEIETENTEVGCGGADPHVAQRLEQEQSLFGKFKEVNVFLTFFLICLKLCLKLRLQNNTTY